MSTTTWPINTDSTGTITWPNYNSWSYYPIKSYWVTINKAENGFIVEKDGKTYIAATAEEVTKLLSEEK